MPYHDCNLTSITLDRQISTSKNWSPNETDEGIFYNQTKTEIAVSIGKAEGSTVWIIPASAFRGVSVKQVNIPEIVREIGSSAFQACPILEVVTLERTTPPACGLEVFHDCPNLQSIKVPAEGLEKYKDTKNTNFAVYSAYIVALD